MLPKKPPTDKLEVTSSPATLYGSVNKKEKKDNPALDIPKVPFDQKRHQQIREKGTCDLSVNEKEIGITEIKSGKMGSGYGTAKVREIMERAIELKIPPDKITLTHTTNWSKVSPLLFYLLMGMEPRFGGQNYPYLRKKYGVLYEMLGEILRKNWDEEQLRDDLDDLQMLLVKEHPDYKDKNKNEIELQDIIQNRDFFQKLYDKKIDFVPDVFIPRLLEILRKDPANKYPDTSELAEIVTGLNFSEIGYAR